MKNESAQHPGLQKAFALTTLTLGTILLVYMVTQEGEPGAIPLLFIFGGLVWYLIIRNKKRSS